MENIIDTLFDEENCDNIVLVDDENNEIEFEQIALIPLDEAVYAILKPVDCTDIGEDEAWAFFIDEENGLLSLVEDEDLVNRIFEGYYALLDDEE